MSTMRRSVWVGALAVGLAVLPGCSQPSEENEAACRMYVEAENEVNAALNEWSELGEPSGGTARTRASGPNRESQVVAAAAIATGEVGEVLREAARLVVTPGEDAGVAYLMMREDVYAACRAEGVRFEVVERDS